MLRVLLMPRFPHNTGFADGHATHTVKKIENSPFDPLVKSTFPKLLPWIPEGITANMVSLGGLIASGLACLCLYLTTWSRWMCLAGALCVFLHWFADTLDGELARARRVSALGFYLDHFGDSLSVALIGIGLFLTAGSHLIIGMAAIMMYLLLIINGLIKTELTRTMELPAFGPTEVHLCVIVVLLLQIFIDFGQPLAWFPDVTGNHGWLTQMLGFKRGLTLIDLFGVVFVLGAAAALGYESVNTARIASRIDDD